MANQAILDAYKTVAGRPADIAGYNYWNDKITNGGGSIDDLIAGLKGEDPNTASVKGIKNAGQLLGFNASPNGVLFDPNALDDVQKSEVITGAYGNNGLFKPDQSTFSTLLNNFGEDFSDYDLTDNFNDIFADPTQRGDLFKSIYQQGRASGSGSGGGSSSGGGSGGSGGTGLSAALGGYGSGQPVDAYLSPFLDQVLNPAIRDLTTATTKARNDLGSQAFMSGAYGDARHGVESGVLTDNFLKNVGDLSGQIRNTGYSEGMGWLGQDLDRQLSAGNANIAADQNQVGNTLSAIGTGSTIGQNSIANQMSLADLLTGYDQYTRNQATTAAQYPGNQMISLINALNGISGNSSTVTSGSTPNNDWASIVGAYLGSR